VKENSPPGRKKIKKSYKKKRVLTQDRPLSGENLVGKKRKRSQKLPKKRGSPFRDKGKKIEKRGGGVTFPMLLKKKKKRGKERKRRRGGAGSEKKKRRVAKKRDKKKKCGNQGKNRAKAK